MAEYYAGRVQHVLPRFEQGRQLVNQIKARFAADRERWRRELSERGWKPREIDALLDSKTAAGAACQYVARTEGRKVAVHTIQNAYSRYRRSLK